jgi:hypothetical protein
MPRMSITMKLRLMLPQAVGAALAEQLRLLRSELFLA